MLKFSDFTCAYQTAPNRDVGECRVVIPEELWPASWKNIYKPGDRVCVLVKKSLYGRYRAGFDYDAFAHGIYRKLGWRPIWDVDTSLYVWDGQENRNAVETGASMEASRVQEANLVADQAHAGTRKVPDSALRYIDDNLLACDADQIDLRFTELSQVFKQPEIKDLNHEKFLGTTHHFYKIDDNQVGIIWEQEDLLTQSVQAFQEEMREKGLGTLRNRNTPAPAEDNFSPQTREQEQQGALKRAPYPTGEKKGVFADTCLTHLGAWAWCESHCRPEITIIVNYLQQRTTVWCDVCDKLLVWLGGYLQATRDQGLHAVVDRRDFDERKLKLVLQTDASHAGCVDTRKSTCGYAIYLRGSYGTEALISWGTKKMTTVSLSSVESELFGLTFGSKFSIYQKLLVDALQGDTPCVLPQYGMYDVESENVDEGDGISELAEMDAEAAIKAVRKSESSKLKHTRRTTGISLGWLHAKWINRKKALLNHRKGTLLSADGLTKRLGRIAIGRVKEQFGVRIKEDTVTPTN